MTVLRGAGGRFAAKHGHTDTAGRKSITYVSWSQMNQRCFNEKHKWFDHYGGRGITVCDDWRSDNPEGFANFIRDMGERPNKYYSIDRKNNNSDYAKWNCRWATKSEQSKNRRSHGFK
jgi:hypothetical protein